MRQHTWRPIYIFWLVAPLFLGPLVIFIGLVRPVIAFANMFSYVVLASFLASVGWLMVERKWREATSLLVVVPIEVCVGVFILIWAILHSPSYMHPF